MTQIDFYFGVGNKLQVACQLATKAFARKLKIALLSPDQASLDNLDRMLWTQPSIGFVPHCRAQAPVAKETAVILDCAPGEALNSLPHDDVLISLCAQPQPLFSRFQRLLEIVSMEDEDRAQARDRFKFYRDRGYQLRTHDLANTGKT